jgi:hypothetical protein
VYDLPFSKPYPVPNGFESALRKSEEKEKRLYLG